MKRIFKKITILAFIFCLSITCIKNKKIKAENINNVYIDIEPIDSFIDIYIDEDLANLLSKNGIIVSNKNGKYYYSTRDLRYNIKNYIILKNDISTISFMIKKVESYAKEYDSKNYKKLTLDYLRAFNKNYYNTNGIQGLAIDITIGHIDDNFIKFVNKKEMNFVIKEQISVMDYFGGYVNLDNRNKLYKYNNDISDRKLIDPYTGKPIDLIHLFCSICATYQYKYQFAGKSMVEIYSWAGDIQCAAHELSLGNAKDMSLLNNGFSNIDDLLADMDARNIGLNFLENNELSDIFYSYYYNFSNELRHRIFIHDFRKFSALKDYDNVTDNFIFENSVAYYMLAPFNGVLLYNIVDHNFLYKYYDKEHMPEKKYREFIRDEFIRFVEEY